MLPCCINLIWVLTSEMSFLCVVTLVSKHLLYMFLLSVNKSHEKTKTNNECILLTSTVCVPKPDISYSSVP